MAAAVAALCWRNLRRERSFGIVCSLLRNLIPGKPWRKWTLESYVPRAKSCVRRDHIFRRKIGNGTHKRTCLLIGLICQLFDEAFLGSFESCYLAAPSMGAA